MFKMETVNDLWEHVAYVILYAPDQFPQESFLSDQDQMTFERAFRQLRDGVQVAYPEEEWASRREMLNAMITDAKESYEKGEQRSAILKLKAFERAIFETNE